MLLYKTLTALALVSALTGCKGFGVDGLRLDPLPATVDAACPHPSMFLPSGPGTVASDEIMIGRIGDALIDCNARRSIAVEAYNGAREALGSD
ncbi:hypothetical protein [Celeribacter halophilus]|uniref:hypothetical protein n=1 Tax=Celeribacter halophilus TaxID=576117 RepID=UPI00082DC369|nr:hypothetical protein [Celeribacter halophilus]